MAVLFTVLAVLVAMPLHFYEQSLRRKDHLTVSVLTLRKKNVPPTSLEDRAADASLNVAFTRSAFGQFVTELEQSAAELGAVSAEALAESQRFAALAVEAQDEADSTVNAARRIRDLIAA